MSDPLVSCRPRTNLNLIPDVLTTFNIVLDPADNLPVIGIFLNTTRHVLRPGVASSKCPGNADALVVVLERSKNVAMAFPPAYRRPDLTEVKIRPNNQQKGLTVFLRLKYQEDTVTTKQDKPRRIGFEVLFNLPAVPGGAITPQIRPVVE